ncbi:hypothetical protein OUZ56_011464 [Daphnia magna]|uniref:Uncharacterized protein n=1 Tax=Daphnia magna TaxID=35525 RepID=A0ABQ9Z1H5_9CRUS|nr:hypothetical protein OUZ56_011464 [Daphnia magna]
MDRRNGGKMQEIKAVLRKGFGLSYSARYVGASPTADSTQRDECHRNNQKTHGSRSPTRPFK